jgi:ubiquinone biosynthesis protein
MHGTEKQASMNVVALAKLYFAFQLTRHPGRYLEMVRVIRKYHLLDVAMQLGQGNRLHSEAPAGHSSGGDCAEHADYLAKALEELGTCFIKLGQVMSTRPDLLPLSYITALSRLQDRVMPVPAKEIVAIIERELGTNLDALFQSFDRNPLATASIAQVHRATLHDGTLVVVKVQRPGVRQQVERDIAVLCEVARFITRYTSFGKRYGLLQMVQEIKQSLSQELDFQQEADNTRLISQGISEFEHLVTPQVYSEYLSRRVLTLRFFAGRHLSDVPQSELRQIDTTTLAQELFSAYLKQMVIDGIFHCDPHPGNVLLTDDGSLALLDFGMVGRFDDGQKEKLLLLLLAFAERQGDRVADIYLEMIEVSERSELYAFKQATCMLISRYHDMSNGRMEIGKVLLELAAVAQNYQMAVPSQLTLLGKAMLNLDGTLRVLAPELNPVQIIRDYIEQVMQKRALSHISMARAYTWFLDARHLLDNLPHRTDTIIDKIAHDQLTVHLKIDHLDTMIHEAARRVTLGMIISSIVLSLGFWLGWKRKIEQ